MLDNGLGTGSRTRAFLMLTSAGLLACNGQAVEPQLIEPQLATLEAEVVSTASGPALVVRAVPADAAMIEERQQVEVQVTTRNGEFERLLLGPELCSRDSRTVRCQEFVVVMTQGHDVRDIETRVRSLPGALILQVICANGECEAPDGFGTVKLFGTDLDDAKAEADGWPGVQFTDYVGVGERRLPEVEESVAENAFGGGGLLSFAEPVQRDQTLQVSSGDSLYIQYDQPDGQPLTAAATM